MVEARERGMSTAEAIRIGTATTGRLITGAALVLAVVAGAFVFSDLVMMKYLAFGLLIALLLDATVVRMFLVPAVMKLLGDDCWWAPRWMKRLQERLGLGETELPDERKRPAVREPEEALVGAGGPAPRPRPPHDPTHPAADGVSRPGATTRIAAQPRSNAPSGAGTTRIPTARTEAASPDEPPTTRLSMAKNAVRNAVNSATARINHPPAGDTQQGHRPPPPLPAAAPREEREIESWLGELRGTAPAGGQPAPLPSHGPTREQGTGVPPARPSADATRAMPDLGALPSQAGGPPAGGGRTRQPRPQSGSEPTTAIPALGTPPDGRGRPRPQNNDATTAIPTSRKQDPEATEKINTREEDEPKRRGGGLSAQDLLRREGRL
jgi:RND superfamily putative drug exporter